VRVATSGGGQSPVRSGTPTLPPQRPVPERPSARSSILRPGSLVVYAKGDAMKFLLMLTDIAGEWDRVPAAEQARVLAGHGVVERELRARKKFVESYRLRPPAEAKTVRLLPGGDRTVTDGPFADTRDVMGGYYVIDCDSMEEALDWARRVPLVYGAIEVRPIWE
jgi:hypothetical protein